MKIRRLLSLLFSCVFILCCLSAPARAITISDLGEVAIITRATGQFETTIPPSSILLLGSCVPLDSGEVVSYKCSYSPRDASVKFGYIGPDGLFYGLDGYNGSINKGIRVSERGSYTLAICNKSDEAVTVKGTVNY